MREVRGGEGNDQAGEDNRPKWEKLHRELEGLWEEYGEDWSQFDWLDPGSQKWEGWQIEHGIAGLVPRQLEKEESLNTQEGVETLFRQHLSRKVKALSRWKSIDVQRINQDLDDYRCISCYLSKQSEQSRIALDPFNSDLSKRNR